MIKYNPQIQHRKSICLSGYDYLQMGMYFRTICLQNCFCSFGKVIKREMVLNDADIIAQQCGTNITEHFPETILHEFVIIPNHVHGIIELQQAQTVLGAQNLPPSSSSNDNIVNLSAEDFLSLPSHNNYQSSLKYD